MCRILSTLPSAAGKYASKWLLSKGVEIWDDDEIIESNGDNGIKQITSKSGRRMQAVLVVDCTGRTSTASNPGNTYKDLEYPYTNTGHVRVDASLKVCDSHIPSNVEPTTYPLLLLVECSVRA